ncbi:YdiK family protein [Virgibacillus doumboii]|uniref:YdiK family protein n=1 Tax=Virgibacillus doumboii TaxID=2697503 RepID=UPI0013DFED08|nr:YdiK family protein [Virgibacillus doumboii]
MRTTPKSLFFIYFIMGILFTYVAIQSVDETIWNLTTVVLAFIATLDFGVGIRMLRLHFKLKKKK